MSLSSGTRLGPYEVLGPLGAGGMGEVYRAKDTRLDRTVAIKVLPSHLSSNPDLRARFEREAKAVSSLNHPHICTLHDVGQQDGTDYIVMELVEGETVLDRLKKGPLPLDQTLRYGIQIADALDKAHRQGVIHRDLKPGNVMLTKAGSKLMDFGLAKRGASGDGGGGVSTLETREKPLTEAGSLLGTYQYMSPEQLEGREADARTDIWALGCVVYEMATGKRAFQGKSQASLISAIMTGEPQPIGQLQPMTPPALERLVRVCLAKEPDDRMQTAHDVMQELKWITEAGGGATAAVIARRAFALPWFGIALAAGVAAGAAGMHLLTSRPVPRPSLLLSILPPVGGTIGQWVAISPDGRQIAFDVTRDGKRQLWLRALAESDPRSLAGTEDAFVPFWSPDNRSLAFFSRGKLKRLDLDGSPPRALADAPVPRGGAWGRDGNIIYTPASNSPLLRVPATGGAVSEATKLGEGHYGHRWPSFLPDGRRFVFTVWSVSPSTRGIYFGSVDSREVRFLQDSPRRAAFVGDRLIFAAGEALLARPFDPDRLEPKGESTSLSNSVSWDADLWGHSSFSVSHGGIVAYRSGAPRYRFVWYDRSGHPTAAGPPDAIIGSLQESPDERMLAFDSLDSLDLESDAFGIWLFDLARNTTTRVTSGQVAMNPLWSSDGSSLIYRSDREEGFLILRKSLRGEGQEEVLWKDDTNWFTPYDLSRDDRFLLYGRPHPQNRLDLWVLPLYGERKPRPLLATPFNESGAQFSPDGKWIAYVSDESGRPEELIRRFPPTEEKWQVSMVGGQQPRWRDDGKELFFIDTAGQLMASGISTGGEPSIRTPVPLFSARIPQLTLSGGRRALYAVSRDGRRFLVAERAEEGGGSISVLVGAEALGPQ